MLPPAFASNPVSSSSVAPILKVAPPLALLVPILATGTWGRGKEVAEVGVVFRAVDVAPGWDAMVDVGGGGTGAAVRRPWEGGGAMRRPAAEVGGALRRFAGGGGAGFLAFDDEGGGGSRVVTVV